MTHEPCTRSDWHVQGSSGWARGGGGGGAASFRPMRDVRDGITGVAFRERCLHPGHACYIYTGWYGNKTKLKVLIGSGLLYQAGIHRHSFGKTIPQTTRLGTLRASTSG